MNASIESVTSLRPAPDAVFNAVFNQAPPLPDTDLFSSDAALIEGGLLGTGVMAALATAREPWALPLLIAIRVLR